MCPGSGETGFCLAPRDCTYTIFDHYPGVKEGRDDRAQE